MCTTVGTYYSFKMTVCCPGWIAIQICVTTVEFNTRAFSGTCKVCYWIGDSQLSLFSEQL